MKGRESIVSTRKSDAIMSKQITVSALSNGVAICRGRRLGETSRCGHGEPLKLPSKSVVARLQQTTLKVRRHWYFFFILPKNYILAHYHRLDLNFLYKRLFCESCHSVVYI